MGSFVYKISGMDQSTYKKAASLFRPTGGSVQYSDQFATDIVHSEPTLVFAPIGRQVEGVHRQQTLVNSNTTMLGALSLDRSRSRVPVVVPNEVSSQVEVFTRDFMPTLHPEFAHDQQALSSDAQRKRACLSVAKTTTSHRSSLPSSSLICGTKMSQSLPPVYHRCHVVDVYNPSVMEAKMRDSLSDNDSGIFPGSSSSSAESDRSWLPEETLSAWQQRTGCQPACNGGEQFRPRLYSKRSNAAVFVPRRQTKLQRTHSNLVTQRRARDGLQSTSNEPPPYDVALARISELRSAAVGGASTLGRSFTLRFPKGGSEQRPQIHRRSQSMSCIYNLSSQQSSKAWIIDDVEPDFCKDEVHGRIIGIASDRTRLIELAKPNGSVPYGFVVALATCSGKKGLYVENVFEKNLAGLLNRGDQILEVDSVPVRVKHISEFYNVLRASCHVRLKVLPLVG